MRRISGARGQRMGRLAMVSVGAVLLPSCYWSREDTEKFEARNRSACDVIDRVVAAGTADTIALLPTNAQVAGDLLVEYMKTAAQLRIKKAEAGVAFAKCESDRLKRILNDSIEIFEKAVEKGLKIGLLVAMAEEIKADVRARTSAGINIAGEMHRLFDIDSSSFVGLGYGVRAEPPGLRDDLPARGSITVWPRITSPDTATLSFSGLHLELDCPRSAGLSVIVEGKKGGFALNANRESSIFPGGWRAAFSQELSFALRVLGDALPLGPFEERMHLDFHFSRDFDELAISTGGFQDTDAIFAAPPPAPVTHHWGVWAESEPAVGVPVRLALEGLEPGARIEVFLAMALAVGTRGDPPLPWLLDGGEDTAVAVGDADAMGHAALAFVAGPELDDRRVFLQGLVTGAHGTRPTAVLPLDVETPFRRGDINADGAVNVSDVVACMSYLFGGGPEPACHRAADANASGVLDISDGVTVLYWLFAGGREPPAPGPSFCGRDPAVAAGDASLGCRSYAACR